MATNIKFDEFKGNKMIVLDCDGKYPFQFGKKKAQLVVEHFEAIKAFAASGDDVPPAE